MNIFFLFSRWLILIVATMLGLAGCGSSSKSPSPVNTVKGTAAKGIIYPGSVKVFAVDASGMKGALLAGPVATVEDGTYSATIGTYTGAVIVEASGIYNSEASGQPVIIDPATPLHAMVAEVSNSAGSTFLAAITPLTELAWRHASVDGTAPITPTTIKEANKLVADLFKLSDILGVQPVAATIAAMGNASVEQQAYTLVLATIDKMADSANGATAQERMNTLLTSLAAEVAGSVASGGFSSTVSSSFASASAAIYPQLFPSGGFDAPLGNLTGVGKKSLMLTLATSGVLPVNTRIYSIQGIIRLPVDQISGQPMATLRSAASGETLPGVLVLAGGTTGNSGLGPLANYEALQKQIRFAVTFDLTNGAGIGDFATLSVDVAPGVTLTAADFSFVSESVKVTDINGVVINGLTFAIR
jgi:hypothetical protein